jgi:uncharacterized membrane protein YjgN (DUF898 family)
MLLVPLTLGWIVPWRTVRLQKALTEETSFGDKPFTFTGRSGPLYKRYWLVWLSAIVLTIATLIGMIAVVGFDMPRAAGGMPTPRPMTAEKGVGIVGVVLAGLFAFAMIRAWYTTRMLNYFAAETRFGGAAFTLQATVGSFVWLAASNYLIRVLSLGFLSAVAEARSMRYIIERLSFQGPVVWREIGQNPDALLTSGEGLAEAFNVDAF